MTIRAMSFNIDAYLRTQWKKMMIYNIYFRRSGFYRFAIKNVIVLLLIATVLIGAFTYVEHHIINLSDVFSVFMSRLETNLVFAVFFLSESLLGLLPPDFFILWVKDFPHPYAMVTVLALLSYAGGIVSYYLGKALSYNPSVAHFVAKRYKKNFILVRKWGGIFIVLAALLPLPFSIVCLLAGLLRFPQPLFFIFSSTRVIRFFAYAIAIFSLL